MNKIINNVYKMKRFLVLIFCLFLCNCATKKVETENKATPEVLYENAMKEFNKKRYGLAGDNFKKIEELYPFTELAGKSVVMSAYSYYKAKKYDDSLLIIEYFKKINMKSDYLEYMFYLEILNKIKYLEKYNKRDLVKMKEVLKNIDDFMLFYRDSEYEENLLKFRRKLNDDAMKNELDIAKFYIKNNDLIGALNHLNMAGSDYEFSANYTPEIIFRIYSIYKHLEYRDGYEKYYKILETNYRNTKWFKYAENKEKK